MVMKELSRDLADEGDELHAYLSTFAADDWIRPTPFKNWTAEDVLEHLLFGDWLNTLSMTEPDRFVDIMARRRSAQADGQKVSATHYLDTPPGRGAELLARWHAGLHGLCELFKIADARARMKWVGPDMSIRSAATARLMETWAHGQDIYDLNKAARPARDRIKHIAVLGVNTFGWTFLNRGLEPPGPPPFVELVAPSGELWRWNDTDPQNRIAGPALDFCQVVTQGRNIAEVDLEVVGETAKRWMAIAQCFAGPPEDPPPPGVRGWASG